MSFKKTGMLFSRSRSQQRLEWSKYDSFYCIFWSADPFAAKLGLMAHHYKLDCLVKRLDCAVVVKVMVRFRILVNVYLDDVSSAAGFNVTSLNLNVVMHHHGPECHARRLVCCLPSSGSHWLLRTHHVWLCLPYLLNLLQPNLIGWYIIISWNVLYKN